jgi:hypothetical protein
MNVHGYGLWFHRVHTEWQRPLSGAHSIMMEKLAQAGVGGWCTTTYFHYIVFTITYNIAVYTPVHFISIPFYSVSESMGSSNSVGFHICVR